MPLIGKLDNERIICILNKTLEAQCFSQHQHLNVFLSPVLPAQSRQTNTEKERERSFRWKSSDRNNKHEIRRLRKKTGRQKAKKMET